MKRLITLLTLGLLISSTAHAQIILSLIQKSIPHYAHGSVTYKDGHEEEYMWIVLPRFGTTTLQVSNDVKHKNKISIPAIDVHHITVWSDELPEIKHVLVYIHADKSKLPLLGTIATDAWGYPIAQNSWGTVYKCNARYEMNKRGELQYIYEYRQTRNGNFITIEEVAAPCYLVCPDFENAQLIGGSQSGSNKMGWTSWPKRIAPFFQSNPAIAERIANHELTGWDIQYILDEMALHHHTAELQPLNPESERGVQQTEQEMETNGTLGDDE